MPIGPHPAAAGAMRPNLILGAAVWEAPTVSPAGDGRVGPDPTGPRPGSIGRVGPEAGARSLKPPRSHGNGTSLVRPAGRADRVRSGTGAAIHPTLAPGRGSRPEANPSLDQPV